MTEPKPSEKTLGELEEKLFEPNPEFTAWTKTFPEKHWAKYDLSAARLGWEAGVASVSLKARMCDSATCWYCGGEYGEHAKDCETYEDEESTQTTASDTPRTDAAEKRYSLGYPEQQLVSINFARQLERELNQWEAGEKGITEATVPSRQVEQEVLDEIDKGGDAKCATQPQSGNTPLIASAAVASPDVPERSSHSGSVEPKLDVSLTIPPAISAAASMIDVWAKTNGWIEYEIGPIASRRLLDRVRQSAPPVEAWRDLDEVRPTEADGDEHGRVLCRWSDEEIRAWPVTHFTKNEPTRVTHWMPLPKFGRVERKT